MNCEEIENQIMDYQEGRLSPARRQEVESHLAGCAGCRRFARQLVQLDAALLGAVKIPGLSADFEWRLRERIQASPPPLSEAQQAERKRQLQVEFDAGMARITRISFGFHNLLKYLSRPLLAIAAACLTWCFTTDLTPRLDTHGPGEHASNLLSTSVASAVFLTVCLAKASPFRPWMRKASKP